MLYARDRTETTSQVWLGLTAGCAKWSATTINTIPFRKRKFYAMSAFFNNTTQNAMDGNIKDTPPIIVVPKPEDDARWAQLQSDLPAMNEKIQERKKGARPNFDAWLAKPDFGPSEGKISTEGLLLHAALADETSNTITVQVNGTNRVLTLETNAVWREGVVSAKAFEVRDAFPAMADVGDFERTNAFSYSVWARITNASSGALFSRMEDRKWAYNAAGICGWNRASPQFTF